MSGVFLRRIELRDQLRVRLEACDAAFDLACGNMLLQLPEKIRVDLQVCGICVRKSFACQRFARTHA